MDTIELLSEPERKHLLHTTIVEMSSKNPDKRLSIPVKKKKKKKHSFVGWSCFMFISVTSI